MSEEFWRASSDFWECVYRSTVAERDEAREMARELAEYARLVRPYSWGRPAMLAWLSIRPGVRKWLEE